MSWTVDGMSYPTRKKLTIDQTKVDADLTDFPVLVKITNDATMYAGCNSDGYDIRFTSSAGVLLKYERESWSVAGNQVNACFWVKVPSVAGATDTDFYIYYRTTDTADGEDKENVWDSYFVLVHHLTGADENALDDSTSNNNDITAKGSAPTFNESAKIYNGILLDGTDDFVSCPDVAVLRLTTKLTFEFWGYTHDAAEGYAFGKFWGSDGKRSYGMGFSGDEARMILGNAAGNDHTVLASNDFNMSTNTWYHIAGSWDKTEGTMRVYSNGTASAVTAAKADDMATNDDRFTIGTLDGSGEFFDGILDEVRVSNEKRSNAWIKASYYSGANTLLTYGSEETGTYSVTDTITLAESFSRLSGLKYSTTEPVVLNGLLGLGSKFTKVVSDFFGLIEILSGFPNYFSAIETITLDTIQSARARLQKIISESILLEEIYSATNRFYILLTNIISMVESATITRTVKSWAYRIKSTTTWTFRSKS